MNAELSCQKLQELLETKEKLFLLDLRSQELFNQWRIERKYDLPVLNIPYFELIERGGKEDFQESIEECVKNELLTKLPRDQKIVVVCPKGDTSTIVTSILQKYKLQALNLSGGMKSWGAFYHKKSLLATKDLSLFQCIRVSTGCLSYIITSGSDALVIDPFRDVQFYADFFTEKHVKPQMILDTHAHADHISGGKELSRKYQIPYFLHPYDGIHPIDMLPATFSYEFSWDKKNYQVGKIRLKTIHIPGHTLGNLAFILNDRYLFSGDSLFISSLSRPDLGGQAKAWIPLHYASIKHLLELSEDLIVLPAHFGTPQEANDDHTYGKTLKELKQINRSIKEVEKGLESFSEYILKSLPEFPSAYIDIKRVNLGLLKLNEEKVEELELGKNICAIKDVNHG